MPHRLAVQVAVPWVGVAHSLVQEPQCETSLVRSAQAPEQAF